MTKLNEAEVRERVSILCDQLRDSRRIHQTQSFEVVAAMCENASDKLRDLLDLLDEKEKVIGRLPKVQGVTVVPYEDSAWVIEDCYGEIRSDRAPVEGVVQCSEDGNEWVVACWVCGNRKDLSTYREIPLSRAYSTREAAEAARNKETTDEH